MILVFGSLNIDIVFRTSEMPRPGNTLLCPDYRFVPGGKGANQAAAAARSEAKTLMVGSVGKDMFAEQILTSLQEAGVDTQYIHTRSLPTGCASVYVDMNGENMIVVASGANAQTTAADIPAHLITDSTTMLIQCETPVEEIIKAIDIGKKHGARIILNLAPARKLPEDTLKKIDYLIMNEVEVTVLALHLGFQEISPTIAARRLTATYGPTCIVTLGGQGAFVCSVQGEWEVPSLEVAPLDSTAAGDAFSGAFAAKMDAGASLESAVRFASAAGGLSCTKVGAQTSLPSKKDIEEALPRLRPLKRLK